LQTIIHGKAPPLSANVPYPLQMLVGKALEHAPEERYQSTRDLVVDLRRLTRQTGETPAALSAILAAADLGRARRGWKKGAAASVAALALLLGGGLLLWRFDRPAALAPRQVVQFDIPAPAGTI